MMCSRWWVRLSIGRREFRGIAREIKLYSCGLAHGKAGALSSVFLSRQFDLLVYQIITPTVKGPRASSMDVCVHQTL